MERLKAELTQAQLAEMLGWNQRTLSDVETGQKIVSVLELMSIAKSLGFDPCEALRTLDKIDE